MIGRTKNSLHLQAGLKIDHGYIVSTTKIAHVTSRTKDKH